ncbi:hypothetical protein GOV10_06285 [Candidatus Woesearchaeota archaeon]|nr:hypothetical protein [Candidatus Woesearchaeota archaeon]
MKKYLPFLLLALLMIFSCARVAPVAPQEQINDEALEEPAVKTEPVEEEIKEEPELPTPEPEPEEIIVLELEPVDTSCQEDNACDGREPGTRYICDYDGSENEYGTYFCDCNLDCGFSKEINLAAYCQTGVQCLNKQKNSEWLCGDERWLNKEKVKVELCSCDAECNFKRVCAEGTPCAGQDLNTPFPCRMEVTLNYGMEVQTFFPDAAGTYECMCHSCVTEPWAPI